MKLALPSILKYKRSYLKHDITASLVVTAISVPQSLAFAVIVGLPPITGLYTAMIAPIVFAMFAHTRRTIVGADSATTAVIASGALLVAGDGTAAHVSAVATICLLAGSILLALSLLRLGFLAELISRPVLIGFFAGVGLQLIIKSLPAMVGVDASGTIWEHIRVLTESLGSINGMALTISVLVVGLVIVLRKTPVPGELAGLVLAVLFAIVFHVKDFGVKTVGTLPHELPQFVVPSFTPDQLIVLFPAALSVALVILAQGASLVRSTAARHNEKARVNQDLFALSLANIASAAFQGFSSNGSIARTQASENANGKTQLVGILSGVLVAILLLFGSGMFDYMPSAALASIVMIIGFYLIRFTELEHIGRTHRAEFIVALVALLGTVTFGVLQGVFIAVIVSLAERLSRQYHPKDAILLRDNEYSDWALERLGSNHDLGDASGILVYSFDGSLFFENSTYFVSRIRRAVSRAKEPVRAVIVDAGAIDSLDYTAVEDVKQFCGQLQEQSISFGFSHVSPEFAHQLEAYGLTDCINGAVYATLSEAIRATKKQLSTAKNS